jgi:sulfatase modifying factor 1
MVISGGDVNIYHGPDGGKGPPRQTNARLVLSADFVIELIPIPFGLCDLDDAPGDPLEWPPEKHNLARGVTSELVEAFCVSRAPITIEQYASFVKQEQYKTRAEIDGYGYCHDGARWRYTNAASWRLPAGPLGVRDGLERQPVAHITVRDAEAFCAWASRASGRKVRLPTEAEWVRAARGHERRRFPWGDALPDPERCNFGNPFGRPSPVGAHGAAGASAFGCDDMAGNVFEWTASAYTQRGSPRPTTAPDPVAPRVTKGGAFCFGPAQARCAARGRVDPGWSTAFIGFRVVVDPVVG